MKKTWWAIIAILIVILLVITLLPSRPFGDVIGFLSPKETGISKERVKIDACDALRTELDQLQRTDRLVDTDTLKRLVQDCSTIQETTSSYSVSELEIAQEKCSAAYGVDPEECLVDGFYGQRGEYFGLPECPDADGDGIVGFSDLLLILDEWTDEGEQCTPDDNSCNAADVDNDGVVGFSDLLLILNDWGMECSSVEPHEAIGAQKLLVVLFRNPDDPIERPAEDFYYEIFDESNQFSLNNYLQDISYGNSWLEGEVLDWFEIEDMPCGTNELRELAVELADPLVDFNNIDRIYVRGFAGPGCGGLGVGTRGIDYTTPYETDEGTQFFSFTTVMGLGSSIPPQDYDYTTATFLSSAIHEIFGHNLGHAHSGIWNCGERSYAATHENCFVPTGYGPIDQLGAGSGTFNAYVKNVRGWFADSQVVTIDHPRFDGESMSENEVITIDLEPYVLQDSVGVKSIKIPRVKCDGTENPSPCADTEDNEGYYHIIYRRELTTDIPLFNTEEPGYCSGGICVPDVRFGDNMNGPEILIDGYNLFTVAGGGMLPTDGLILDMSPFYSGYGGSSCSGAGNYAEHYTLDPNMTFVDPHYGTRITTLFADDEKATVQIELLPDNVCGNGIVDTAEEQCDIEDLQGATCQTRGYEGGILGCSNSCDYDTTRCLNDGRVVFVTEDDWTGGDIGGLQGADIKCNEAAVAAGLDGDFKAWLSDSTTNAFDRIEHYNGGFMLPDGKPLTWDWNHMTNAGLMTLLDVGPDGETLQTQGYRWTGTDLTGASTDLNCLDWTSNSPDERGTVGSYLLGCSQWTDAFSNRCDIERKLVCIEDSPENCGNHIIEPEFGEECDDGNYVDSDSCTTACLENICGDGSLNVGIEHCDDGNTIDGDGCTSCVIDAGYQCTGSPSNCFELPENTHRVFITNKNDYKPGYNFEGIEGADNACQAIAINNQLGGTWRAWISDSQESVIDRFTIDPDYEFVLLDFTTIASNWQDLTDETIEHEIDLDEFYQEASANSVWTGTNADGTLSTDTCLDWTTNEFEIKGMRGFNFKTDSAWTEQGLTGCNQWNHFYCFEQLPA